MKEEHSILKQEYLDVEPEIRSEALPKSVVNESNVWPVENNIVFERIAYNQGKKLLMVKLTNLSVKPIKVIQAGVKYSNSQNESIIFVDEKTVLQPGENNICISAPQGNPSKFVIRTNLGSGAGEIRNNSDW
ncbi:hypothetical protein ACFLTH_11230 [Bacteroidota bacterium]